MAKRMDCWTLVQHSGFGYGGKSEFAKAVEVRNICSRSMENRVRKAGGMIFESYLAASDAEDKINGVTGDRPFLQAAGRFSDERLDNLPIYIPATEVEV